MPLQGMQRPKLAEKSRNESLHVASVVRSRQDSCLLPFSLILFYVCDVAFFAFLSNKVRSNAFIKLVHLFFFLLPFFLNLTTLARLSEISISQYLGRNSNVIRQILIGGNANVKVNVKASSR